MRENPWTAKIKRERQRSSADLRYLRLKRAGIGIGTYVHVSWLCDAAYGIGSRSFEGKIVKLDSWVTVVNKAGTICHLPLTMAKIEATPV